MKTKKSHAMGIASLVCLLLTAMASYVWAAGIVSDGLLFSLLPVVFGAAFTVAEARRLSFIEKRELSAAAIVEEDENCGLDRSA